MAPYDENEEEIETTLHRDPYEEEKIKEFHERVEDYELRLGYPHDKAVEEAFLDLCIKDSPDEQSKSSSWDHKDV